MVIVAGHITVEPQRRESYLAGCVRIVEQARRAVGCLDVAICADLVGRVNIFERWESQAALETFRSSGPDTEERRAMLTVSVQGYDIADVRPVFGKAANLDSVSILPAVVRHPGVQVDHTTGAPREKGGTHETDDHHERLRRWSDAGTRRAG